MTRPDCQHCGEPVVVEKGVAHFTGVVIWFHRHCHFERIRKAKKT